jgi:hypothetical protein
MSAKQTITTRMLVKSISGDFNTHTAEHVPCPAPNEHMFSRQARQIVCALQHARQLKRNDFPVFPISQKAKLNISDAISGRCGRKKMPHRELQFSKCLVNRRPSACEPVPCSRICMISVFRHREMIT